MEAQQVVDHYGAGNVAEAARVLGLTRQTVYNWIKAGTVPQDWQFWMERDSAGKLKADHRKPSDR
jgi:DNA invertase Pin-like site-specific DNA recombinase